MESEIYTTGEVARWRARWVRAVPFWRGICRPQIEERRAGGRDYATIIEVLTAYIRKNAPRPPEPSEEESPPASGTAANGATEGNGGRERAATPDRRTPPADIQAILNVLRRRDEDSVPMRYRAPLDLRGANLREANLQGAYLVGAIMPDGSTHD